MFVKSKKELEIVLSKLKVFENPKLELEQYETDPSLASKILWTAYMKDDIKNKIIADLGAGTGILGIGCLLLDAKKVYFVEKDLDAIKVLKNNLDFIKTYFNTKFNYKIYNCDVLNFNERTDLVIMNPPFGVQSRELYKFLDKAMEISDIFYSIHDLAKKDKIIKYIAKEGWEIKFIVEDKLILKKKYWFHEKEKEYIDVFWLKAFRPQ